MFKIFKTLIFIAMMAVALMLGVDIYSHSSGLRDVKEALPTKIDSHAAVIKEEAGKAAVEAKSKLDSAYKEYVKKVESQEKKAQKAVKVSESGKGANKSVDNQIDEEDKKLTKEVLVDKETKMPDEEDAGPLITVEKEEPASESIDLSKISKIREKYVQASALLDTK
jgi:hypothetical protein